MAYFYLPGMCSYTQARIAIVQCTAVVLLLKWRNNAPRRPRSPRTNQPASRNHRHCHHLLDHPRRDLAAAATVPTGEMSCCLPKSSLVRRPS